MVGEEETVLRAELWMPLCLTSSTHTCPARHQRLPDNTQSVPDSTGGSAGALTHHHDGLLTIYSEGGFLLDLCVCYKEC